MVVAGAGGLTGLYAWNVEPNTLVVETVPVPLNGLTIGFLSDFHVNAPVPPAHIARAAQMLMTHAPDLILLGGDYVTRSASDARDCADALAQLAAPLGVFAILGNHDYWVGHTDQIVAQLTRVGIRMLQNESVAIGAGNDRIYVIGLDDVWEKHVDLDRALAMVPDEACKIVIVHEPDFGDESARQGIDLQLSGHSHGGQVRLPYIGAPILPYLGRQYPMGLQRAGASTWVYTTRGVGMISPGVRFNCPPEITFLKLQTSA